MKRAHAPKSGIRLLVESITEGMEASVVKESGGMRKYTIVEITDSEEDKDAMDGDASHEGYRSVQRILEGERVRKIDEGKWPGLPFTCEASSEEEALEKYNEENCSGDYLKATECEFADEDDESLGNSGDDMESKALAYAEKVGIYEYRVNGNYIEYWTFYGKDEGWYFVRYDLVNGKEVFRGANIPWDSDAEQPIPAFLMNGDATLYNYNVG